MWYNIKILLYYTKKHLSFLLKFPKEFARNPSTDFTRNNGLLPVSKLIHIILGMRKDTIATELREHFGAVPNAIPTPSAFVQQRGKLLPKAFETIFHRFNEKFSPHCPINGYSLIAAYGSDVRFYGMPDETEYIIYLSSGRGRTGLPCYSSQCPFEYWQQPLY